MTIRDEILRWLQTGLSARDASKLTGASPSYAHRVRREAGIPAQVRHRDQTTLAVAWEKTSEAHETRVATERWMDAV